ncbi:MAG: hypothetical protein EXR99_11180 [Gemmataceae bacterium]|nr:hypothetical protein [Gemmataceae bacterium]
MRTGIAFLAALIWGLIFLAPVPRAWANPPVLSYLFPAGCQRGKEVEVRLGGLFLHETCGVDISGQGLTRLSLPKRLPFHWFEGPVLPLQESQQAEDYPKELAFRLRADAQARKEPRLIRVFTSEGAHGNCWFELGDLSEIIEKEYEDLERPVGVTLPLTINGRIFPRGDFDDWEVTLEKGAHIRAAISSDKLGYPLDARLEVRNALGKILSENDDFYSEDPALFFTAPASGKYCIRVLDSQGKGSPAHVYRLTLEKTPAILSHFPLGGKAGETVSLEMQLASGQPEIKKIQLADSPGVHLLPLQGELLVPFDFSTFQELLEPAREIPAEQSVVLNGRISTNGQTDEWLIPLGKDETVSIESQGMSLGSSCRPVLVLKDATGKDAARGAPQGSIDPILAFKAPKQGMYKLAITEENPAAAGPEFAYRVKVIRGKNQGVSLSINQSSLTLPREKGQAAVQVKLVRHGGFDGPVRLEWDALPKEVEVTPAKPVLAKGANQLELKLKAGPGARIEHFSWKIRAIPEGETKALPAAGIFSPSPGFFPVDNLLLQVALPCPFKLTGGYDMKWAPRGGPLTRTYKIQRNGFDGPIEVELADKQMRHLQGVRGGKIIVPAGQDQFEYSVQLSPWMEIGRTSRSCVAATALVKDGDATHRASFSSVESNEQLVAVVEAGKCDIKPLVSLVGFSPGEKVEIPVEVFRAPGFSGPVRLSAVVPPWLHGCEASKVVLGPQETLGKITIQTGKDATEQFFLKINGALETPQGKHEAQVQVEMVPRKTR